MSRGNGARSRDPVDRAESRWRLLAVVLGGGSALVGVAVQMLGKAASLRAAVRRLPRPCQALVSLLLTDPPPSYAEIAAGLSIPVGSIGPTRTRCLARLRELLAAETGLSDHELLRALRQNRTVAGEVPERVVSEARGALTGRPPGKA